MAAMHIIKKAIINSILRPKEGRLLEELHSLATGNINSYVPDIENPQYYEIWFYSIFDFNYTIIGEENYTIELANSKDEALLNMILSEYDSSNQLSEDTIAQLKKDCEFNFISDCWTELELKLNRNIRGFLVEHGIIRGWDINQREPIDGEEIGDTLNGDGIPNSH